MRSVPDLPTACLTTVRATKTPRLRSVGCRLQRYATRAVLTLALTASLLISALQATDIVAHRGASHDAPENTLAAFRLAWEQKADAIEGDFYLTADHQIICIHDKDTKRVSDRKLIVADSTLNELQQLDVGRWKSEKFTGEHAPTLQQVLQVVPPGKRLLIEIKSGPEIVPYLAPILERTQLKPEQLRIIAFDAAVIAACKRQLPGIKSYWLTSFKQDEATGLWKPSLETVLKTARQVGADGVDVKAEDRVVNEQFVEGIRDAGLELHVWTVNDPRQAERYQRLGIDSITTDRPAMLKSHLTR